MAGQPEHPPAKAPMARTARNYHHVELVLLHFITQRTIAALVLGLRKLFPHSITVIGRIAHVGERQRLVELCSHDIPRLRANTWWNDIHCKLPCRELALFAGCKNRSRSSVERLDIGFFGELRCRGDIVLEELAELLHAHLLWLDSQLG